MTESKAGERQAEVVSIRKPLIRKSPKTRSAGRPKQSWRAVKLTAIALVLLGGYWFFIRDNNSEVNNTEGDLVNIKQSTNVQDVVRRYGASYTQAIDLINKTPYAGWDRQTLDKAYFSLLYADKIKAYTQVKSTLFLVESAKRGGLDIDDNSYGIDQKKRDEIRNRAIANSPKATITGAGIE